MAEKVPSTTIVQQKQGEEISTTLMAWKVLSRLDGEDDPSQEEDAQSCASFHTAPDPDEFLTPEEVEINTSHLEEGGGFKNFDPLEIEFFIQERKDVVANKRPTELTSEMSPHEKKGRSAAWRWFGRKRKGKYEVTPLPEGREGAAAAEADVVEENVKAQTSLTKEKSLLNRICKAWVRARLRGFEELTE